MKCKERLMSPLPLPTIPHIRNFLLKGDTSARLWIYYIRNCYVNSDAKTSRQTIENILNKSFVFVCWLNNNNFQAWKWALLLKTNKEVSVRDYQVPKQNKFSIPVYRSRKMSYIYRNESTFKCFENMLTLPFQIEVTSRHLISWEISTRNFVISAISFIKNDPNFAPPRLFQAPRLLKSRNQVVQLPPTPLFQPPHHSARFRFSHKSVKIKLLNAWAFYCFSLEALADARKSIQKRIANKQWTYCSSFMS